MNHSCNEEDNSQWRNIPGRDSSSTGESKFECIVCGREQFRGGWCSSWQETGEPLLQSELEKLWEKKHPKPIDPDKLSKWQKFKNYIKSLL